MLLVDGDRDYSRALALLLRRDGHRVRIAQTRLQALQACRRERYDVAIVDLFLRGGGGDLARILSPRVGTLLLSLAARMARPDVLEAALGFPVLRKATLPRSLRRKGWPGRTGRRPDPRARVR